MKSAAEISVETQIVEQRVRSQRDHLQTVFGVRLPDRALEIHFPLPTSTVAVLDRRTGQTQHLTTTRAVVATNVGSGFEYQVNERWIDQSPDSPPNVQDKVILRTESAQEALFTAYYSTEALRLLATLSPFNPSRHPTTDPASAERVTSVETLVNAQLLSPSERLHTRMDVVDFLQGRLSDTDFVENAIRRLYHREGESQTQTLDYRQSPGEFPL